MADRGSDVPVTPEVETQAAQSGDTSGGIVGGTTETGGRALAVVTAAESGPASSRLLGFAEAKEFLRTHGIDLETERTKRVRDALRWGETTQKEADKFGAAFDSAEVSEADLQALIRRLEVEPDLEQRVILGIDNATPEQGFDAKIDRAGIKNYVYRRFSEYQRVDPMTGKPLENQEPTGKAGITFLPHTLNLPLKLRRISANDQLAKMQKGTKYLGPNGYMIWFRQCLDSGMRAIYPDVNIDKLSPENYRKLVEKAILNPRIDPYLPDTKTGTQFPDLRHADDGAVSSLDFDPNPGHREVGLSCYDPGFPGGNLGGRDALGTFLS